MSGNPLVRFDEGRVGRTSKVSPSLLLYRLGVKSCSFLLRLTQMSNLLVNFP